MLSLTTTSLENWMYLKLNWFGLSQSIIFSENNHKKQAHLFDQNNSLALHTLDEILCNLVLRNHWTWTWKISNCLTGLRLVLWYHGLGLKKYLDTSLELDWFYYILEWDLKSTNLLDLDWFYDILDMDLKNSWTNLLRLDSCKYN